MDLNPFSCFLPFQNAILLNLYVKCLLRHKNRRNMCPETSSSISLSDLNILEKDEPENLA